MSMVNSIKTLGVSVFVSAVTMSMSADTGAWSTTAAGEYNYFNSANWVDSTVAQGSGHTAFFTNSLSSMRISVTNDLALWRMYVNAPNATVLDLEGVDTTLELSGAETPQFNIISGRLNTFIPLAGSDGFIKYSGGTFYPYCRSQMSGPITMSGGTLGVDFNRDADSTNSAVLNHLQPDGLTYANYSGQVRFGPRASHGSDQSLSFQTAAGSSIAEVTVSGLLSSAVSAGQLLESADGALTSGTYIKTILADSRVLLSQPALLSGDYDITIKAKSFTSEQNFDFVDMKIAGTLFMGALTVSIDDLKGIAVLNLQSSGGGVAEIGNTGDFHSEVRVFGDLDLTMTDQRPIPAEPATNAAFHVDASDLSTMTTTVSGDDVLVTHWYDKNGTMVTPTLALFAVSNTRNATPPTLVTNALNGLPVLDFGPAGSKQGFVWTTTSIGIRTVFWVIGSQEGGGLLLGSKDGNLLSFDRGTDLVLAKGDTGVYTEPHTKDHALFGTSMSGDLWINGDRADMHFSGLSGGYDLVAFRNTTARNASGFAMRNNANTYPNRTGGQRLAEVIIYDRTLTDQEVKDTQAYLAKKWFDRDMPGYGAAELKNVEFRQNDYFSTDSTLTQQGTEPLSVEMMTVGSNRTVTVSDGSEVSVERTAIDSYASLEVDGGSLSIAAYETPDSLPVTNALMHFDASDAASVILTNGSEVALWQDADGGSHFAESVDGFRPTLASNILNGMPVVDFGAAGSRQFLIWDTNMVIRSFFYVMNLKADNITPIGTHRKYFVRKSHFTRYTGTGMVWDPSTQETVLGGECYINGTLVQPQSYSLTANQFCLLGQVMEGSSAACAFGCEAYDHNNPADLANRTGGQQLAEVVIYNRKLTHRESLDVQAYLYWKWFGETIPGYSAPGQPLEIGSVEVPGGSSGSLSLSGDATVDMGVVSGDLSLTSDVSVVADVAASSELNIDGIKPAGSDITGAATASSIDFEDGSVGELSVEDLTLENDALVSVDVIGANSDHISVSGALTVEGGGTFEMNFDARDNYSGVFDLITFGSLDSVSRESLSSWTISGNIPAKYKTTITVSDDKVSVTISERGMLILLK